MRKIFLFIKQNAPLFLLVCFTVTTVMMYAFSGPSEDHCRFVYDFQVCDFGPKDQEKTDEEIMVPVEKKENSNESIKTFMPLTGTKWVYEGKRTFYDSDSTTIKEVVAKKEVEITGLVSEGKNVRAKYKETYTNDPDFREKEGSFLFSENSFAFDGKSIMAFPLVKGQRLSFDSPERDDDYYDYYVSDIFDKEVFGKQTTCYAITYKTLADVEIMVFCEGVGYISDYYKHNGTQNEADYRLVSIGVN